MTGKGAGFGDMSISSTSANQRQLSIYGALRTADQMVTIVLINKTFGTLTSSLALEKLTSATGNAKVYQYSAGNLGAIVALPDVPVPPPNPVAPSPTSTISSYSFPAGSITLFVIPQ